MGEELAARAVGLGIAVMFVVFFSICLWICLRLDRWRREDHGQ